MKPANLSTNTRQTDSSWLWLGPLLFMLVISIVTLARSGGLWAESDSTTFSSVIRNFVDQGRLVPSSGAIYPSGFAFQSISAVILALTGVDVATLQQIIYPLLTALVVLPAWVAYRALTSSPRAATIATMLLFTQPEFLFVIMRSSHEKFTRTFMLLCLFLLVWGFTLRTQPRVLAVTTVLFYLLIFGSIAGNNLLAQSFIVATALALLGGWVLEHRLPRERRQHVPALRRLLFVSCSSLVLAYLFMFYLYPPTSHQHDVLKESVERIQKLFATVQEETTTPTTFTGAYTYLSFGWTSTAVYLLVSIANWIILGSSFVVWVRQGWRWLWRGLPPPTSAWLLWLLYAAFAFQGLASVVVDASGALSSNIQHRLFPSVSIIATGIVSQALAQWRPRRFAGSLAVVLALGIGVLAVLSVMKATNEPLVSNKWSFYRSTEMAALQWVDPRLRNAPIWTEYDERLSVAFVTAQGRSVNRNTFQASIGAPATRVVLMTDITRLRSTRLNAPLPVPPDALRIYDNGEAEIYRLRPQTPFQK